MEKTLIKNPLNYSQTDHPQRKSENLNANILDLQDACHMQIIHNFIEKISKKQTLLWI